MGTNYSNYSKRKYRAFEQNPNQNGDYEVSGDYVNMDDLNSIVTADSCKKDVVARKNGQRIICAGNSRAVVENNLIVTWETLGQTTWWLVNYLIVARLARELQKYHTGAGYIFALATCLFFFMFATTLMKRSSDQALYYCFLIFVLLCIYFK